MVIDTVLLLKASLITFLLLFTIINTVSLIDSILFSSQVVDNIDAGDYNILFDSNSIVDTNILNVNGSDISDDYEQPSINENSMDLLILMVYK